MTGKHGTLFERFERYYIPEPNSGCWLWIGALRDTGYGQLSVGAGQPPVKAHRFSYLWFKGPIPEGLDVMHACDMRCCVNPEHLSVGTRKQNMDDARRKNRIPLKITAAQVAEICQDKRLLREIAADYGVSLSWVSKLKIANRETS